MSAQPNIKKKDTTVKIAEDEQLPTEKRKKREARRKTPIKKTVIHGTILLLIIAGFAAQTTYMLRLEKDRRESVSSLHEIILQNARKISSLQTGFSDMLSETDDPATANAKFSRKVRSLSTTVGQCHEVDGKCNYTQTIGFFYTSHHVLKHSHKFYHDTPPQPFRTECEKEMKNSDTGQVWCKNEGRADTFYHSFNANYSRNPDNVPWPYLNHSALMLKPGESWTDLSQHEYYGLEDNSIIKIKQSGIYMLFSSVQFDVTKGSSISYAVRRNKDLLKGCRLPAIHYPSPQKESCLVFLVAYLNKGDEVSMTISSGTKFYLGETNFYLGLYHLTSVEISVNNVH